MTTPRIEEIANSLKAKLWQLGLTAKDIDVDTYITQAHQAGIDEAVERERNRFMRLIQECSRTTEPEWIAKDLMEALSENEEV